MPRFWAEVPGKLVAEMGTVNLEGAQSGVGLGDVTFMMMMSRCPGKGLSSQQDIRGSGDTNLGIFSLLP